MQTTRGRPARTGAFGGVVPDGPVWPSASAFEKTQSHRASSLQAASHALWSFAG